jgi:hypothetical protein
METVDIKPHQCLLDIAMQTKGSIDTLFEHASENGFSITDNLTPGKYLQVPDVTVTNKRVFQYLRDNGIFPANAFTAEDEAAIRGGIGYMGIQIDFRVS